MFDLISAMSLVIISWFILFCLFSGLGFVFLRIIGIRPDSGTRWLEAFWMGWALSLLILQLWHLAFPVDGTIFLLLLGLASVGIITNRHELMPVIRRLAQQKSYILVLVIVIVWFANHAIDMPTAFDSGYRDIPLVQWYTTYPLVPGMNNLFASFAFNQSYYLYAAFLNVGPWHGTAYHIALGLLYVVFLSGAIWAVFQFFWRRNHDERQFSWLLLTLFVPYIFFSAINTGAIVHYLTDAPIDLLGFLLIVYVVDFLQCGDYVSQESHYSLLKIAILVLAGFTIKLSFVVFGAGLAILLFVIWLIHGGWKIPRNRLLRLFGWIIFFAVLFIVPWMARGVVTSGYIAYPQTIGAFDVDWREPIELVKARQEMLATNTRLRYGDPDIVLSSWDWLIPWFNSIRGNVFIFLLPLGITSLSWLAIVTARIRNRSRKQSYPLGLWLFIPLIIMFIFWFLTAPNPKYVQYLIWIATALSVLFAVLAWWQISWRVRTYMVLSIMTMGLAYVLYVMLTLGTFLLPAGPYNGFYERDSVRAVVYVTDSGLELNTPRDAIKQCWNVPLPCTPLPTRRIKLRVPGELRYGFNMNDT